MGKNTVRDRKRHFHGSNLIHTLISETETEKEQEATKSSSRAKKLTPHQM